MPLNQVIIHLSNFINILCNIWLFSYLNSMTNKNTALGERDRMKEKKRNLMPVQVGMLHLLCYVITVVLMTFIFSYKSLSFDSATKAFLIAIYGDFFHCFLGPLVVLLNSSDAVRRLRQLYRAVIQTLRTK